MHRHKMVGHKMDSNIQDHRQYFHLGRKLGSYFSSTERDFENDVTRPIYIFMLKTNLNEHKERQGQSHFFWMNTF